MQPSSAGEPGKGQGEGAHADAPPGAANVPPAQATDGAATTHAPVMGSQHAVGWAQVAAPHTEESGALIVVPAGHAASGPTTEHAPLVVSQQAVG